MTDENAPTATGPKSKLRFLGGTVLTGPVLTGPVLTGAALTWIRIALGAIAGICIAILSQQVMELNNTNAAAGHYGVHMPAAVWRIGLSEGIFLWTVCFLAALGVMGRRALAIWAIISAAFLALVLWHWNAHLLATNHETEWLLLLPALFIAHELMVGIDFAKGWRAPYGQYFEQAWKRGIHLGLSLLFTGLFWAILLLGGTMLHVIGFEWLQDALGHYLVSMPLVGAAFAFAVNVGDVNPAILSNVRALVLNVLRWLAPIMVLLGVIFAISLGFSGLEPLWKMDAATPTLLSASIILVLLINAVYQEGQHGSKAGEKPSQILDWSIRLGAVLILVFSALALYSLSLRVGQYGLTEQRILVLVAVLIALGFGIAYCINAFWPTNKSTHFKAKPFMAKPFMEGLETSNVVMAYVKVAVLAALVTPLAPPSGLAVASQVGRLNAGKISVDKFDFHYLRFKAGSYGASALTQLAASANPAIAAKAKETIALTEDARYDEATPQTPEPLDLSGVTIVYPKGGRAPTNWDGMELAEGAEYFSAPNQDCRKNGDTNRCYLALSDIDHDGKMDGLFLGGANPSLSLLRVANGKMNIVGTAIYLSEQEKEKFKSGEISFPAPTISPLRIGGRTIQLRIEDWLAGPEGVPEVVSEGVPEGVPETAQETNPETKGD